MAKEHQLYLKLRNGTEYILYVTMETVLALYRQAAQIISESRRSPHEGQEPDQFHILENSPDRPPNPSDAQKRENESAT